LFIGGAVRWLVDRRARAQPQNREATEAQITAQSDRGPGVLLASGYIAGGAIAGIVIAFLAGVMGQFDSALQRWATAHNPFFAGPDADWLALLPFTTLVVLLWLVGRGSVMATPPPKA
jgi:hypothetical protein